MEGIFICFINHLPVYYLFYQLKLKPNFGKFEN